MFATFCSYRRSYSLDVEVSASGFTKDLERDSELLHPAGPEGEDADEEESDEEEATEEELEKEEDSLDMEEYEHAIQELEGLKLSDTHANIEDEDKEDEGTGKEKETDIAATTRGDGETKKNLDEELCEAEDECPELADLSTSNKDFKPFR